MALFMAPLAMLVLVGVLPLIFAAFVGVSAGVSFGMALMFFLLAFEHLVRRGWLVAIMVVLIPVPVALGLGVFIILVDVADWLLKDLPGDLLRAALNGLESWFKFGGGPDGLDWDDGLAVSLIGDVRAMGDVSGWWWAHVSHTPRAVAFGAVATITGAFDVLMLVWGVVFTATAGTLGALFALFGRVH